MKWPVIDNQQTFEDVEQDHRIAGEIDDIPGTYLGVHPCRSYYRRILRSLEVFSLAKSRRQFDAVAAKYVSALANT